MCPQKVNFVQWIEMTGYFFFIILLSMGIFDKHHHNSMQRVSKKPDHVLWQGVDHQIKLEVICPLWIKLLLR